MRKWTTTPLTMLLTTLLLAGCTAGPQGAGSAAPKADKPGEITLFTWIGMRREPLDAAIEAYNAKHPNLKVRVRELQPQQMTTQDGKFNAAALEGGDLALMPESLARNFFNEGKLKDLSTVRLPQFNDLAAQVYPDLGRADGKRIGLPVAINPSLLMIEPAAFDSVGVKQPPVDWTVPEFEQTLGALKAAGANLQLQSEAVLEPLLKAYGGGLYDPVKQGWTLDAPENQSGLALAQRLTKAGILEAPHTGSTVTIVTGNGPGVPALRALPGFFTLSGAQVQPYPKGPKGRSVPVSATLGCVLADSANPEGATDFLRELIANPAMQMAMAKGGTRPLINDSQALAAWSEAVGDQAAQATELSLQGAYVPAPNSNTREAIIGLAPYLNGTATLEQILPGLIAKLE